MLFDPTQLRTFDLFERIMTVRTSNPTMPAGEQSLLKVRTFLPGQLGLEIALLFIVARLFWRCHNGPRLHLRYPLLRLF